MCAKATRTVRYYGEEMAAVAGTTKQACLDALRAIEVEAEPLPIRGERGRRAEADRPAVWDGPAECYPSRT